MRVYILEHGKTRFPFKAYDENHAQWLAFRWADRHDLQTGDCVTVALAQGNDKFKKINDKQIEE